MSFSGIEKRRFVRAKYPCHIIIYAPKEHTIYTHTEDIGGGGVRVVIEERLVISSLVGLELYIERDTKPIVCKGRVVWVVERESVYRKGFIFFDTGIEFVDINESDRETIIDIVESIVLGHK